MLQWIKGYIPYPKDGICRYVRRHSKTIIVASVATIGSAGLFYYGYHSLKKSAASMIEKEMMLFQKKEVLEHHMLVCQNECQKAFFQFLPNLQMELYELTPVESRVKDLKKVTADLKINQEKDKDILLKKNQMELWEHIKELGFIRFLVGIYSFSLLFILLQIQISILSREALGTGDYSEKDTLNIFSSEKSKSTQDFLANIIKHILKDCLPDIITSTQQVVESHVELQSWKVDKKTAVKDDEICELLQSIHKDVLSTIDWNTLILNDNTDKNCFVGNYFDETFDLIESEYFSDALTETIQFTLQNRLDELRKNFLVEQESNKATFPLAKIIPQMKHLVGYILEKKSNVDAQTVYGSLSGMESVKGLQEAVFLQGLEIN